MASVARIETSDERQDKNNQGNVLQELFDTMLDFVFAPWLQENSANDGSSVFSGSEVSTTKEKEPKAASSAKLTDYVKANTELEKSCSSSSFKQDKSTQAPDDRKSHGRNKWRNRCKAQKRKNKRQSIKTSILRADAPPYIPQRQRAMRSSTSSSSVSENQSNQSCATSNVNQPPLFVKAPSCSPPVMQAMIKKIRRASSIDNCKVALNANCSVHDREVVFVTGEHKVITRTQRAKRDRKNQSSTTLNRTQQNYQYLKETGVFIKQSCGSCLSVKEPLHVSLYKSDLFAEKWISSDDIVQPSGELLYIPHSATA